MKTLNWTENDCVHEIEEANQLGKSCSCMLSHKPVLTSFTLILMISFSSTHSILSFYFSFCHFSFCKHSLCVSSQWGYNRNTLTGTDKPLCAIFKVISICWSEFKELYKLFKIQTNVWVEYLIFDPVSWTQNVMDSLSAVPQWLVKSSNITPSKHKSSNKPRRQKGAIKCTWWFTEHR